MIKGSHLISYQRQITRRLMSNQYQWTQFCQPAILLLTYCEISLFLELSSKLGSSSAYEWNNYLKSWLKQNLKIWMLWSFVTLNLKHSSFNQQKFETIWKSFTAAYARQSRTIEWLKSSALSKTWYFHKHTWPRLLKGWLTLTTR